MNEIHRLRLFTTSNCLHTHDPYERFRRKLFYRSLIDMKNKKMGESESVKNVLLTSCKQHINVPLLRPKVNRPKIHRLFVFLSS